MKRYAIENITLRPSSVPCFNFKKNGKYEKRTAIIAPIRFKVLDDGSIAVAWACSLGQECEDEICLYAKAAKNIENENVIQSLGEKNEAYRKRRNKSGY